MKNPELMKLALDHLARSGLTKRDADRMGIEVLDAAATAELTKTPKWAGHRVPSYRIPYYGADGEALSFYRLRFLEPVVDAKGKDTRYWQPKSSGVEAYLPPGLDWLKVGKDAGCLIIILEGEKKSATARKVLDRPVVGLGGIWNIIDKDTGGLPGAIVDFAYEGRPVEIAYDGDAHTNPLVRRARDRLAGELIALGASVVIVELPIGEKVDDFILKNGKAAYLALPRRPVDAKEQIRLLRFTTLPARAKRERISAIVLRDLAARGTFYRTTEGNLAYFDRIDARLLSLDAADDTELHAITNDRYGLNASEVEFNFVFKDIEAHAFLRGTRADLYYFAHYDKARRTLYLNAGDNRVFRVTAHGHEVAANGVDGVIFRTLRLFERVEPSARLTRAAIDAVLTTPNFKGGTALTADEERLLFEAWIWTIFFPELHPTRAILLITGPAGSGKSDGLRGGGMMLFHRDWMPTVFSPEKIKDVTSALTHDPLVAFDNADGIGAKGVEDLLATAATGGQTQMAALYKTNETVYYRLIAHVAAASRNPNIFSRDDIVDRLILLPCEARQSWKPEAEVLEGFRAMRPDFWAYILATAPKIIKAVSARRASLHTLRLADFASFAVAIAPVIGSTADAMRAALTALANERGSFALERSVIPTALDTWLDRRIEMNLLPEEITSGELFNELKGLIPKFPYRTPQSFGLKFRESLPALRQLFDITERGIHGRKIAYSIRRPKRKKR